MNTEESLVLWKRRIEDRESSGQQVTVWCRENKVSKQMYYYWLKKVKNMTAKKDTATPLFAEVSQETLSKQGYANKPSELTISWQSFTIKITDLSAVPMVTQLLNSLGTSC